jgi:hypothetical protein
VQAEGIRSRCLTISSRKMESSSGGRPMARVKEDTGVGHGRRGDAGYRNSVRCCKGPLRPGWLDLRRLQPRASSPRLRARTGFQMTAPTCSAVE